MKLKSIYTILFTLLVVLAKAQIPGFMGHRLLVSGILSPNVTFPFDTYGSDYTASLQVRPKVGIGLDYVINRKKLIGFKYTYSYMRMKNLPIFTPDLYSGSSYDYISPNSSPGRLVSHTLMFRYTIHNTGNLPAPLGFFYGLGFGMSISTLNDLNGSFPRLKSAPQSGAYVTKINPDFNLFFGIRRGIGKRMTWAANFELNYWALGFMLFNSDYSPYWFSGLGGQGTNNEVYETAGEIQYTVLRKTNAIGYYNSNVIGLSFELSFLP